MMKPSGGLLGDSRRQAAFGQSCGGPSPPVARYIYGFIFLLTNLSAWVVRDYSHQALNQFHCKFFIHKSSMLPLFFPDPCCNMSCRILFREEPLFFLPTVPKFCLFHQCPWLTLSRAIVFFLSNYMVNSSPCSELYVQFDQ